MRTILLGFLAMCAGCDLTAETVAFGDSVTFGVGGRRGGWVSHLEEARGAPIANFGLPGERVVNGKGRFGGPVGPLVLAPGATTLLLLHGGNDVAEVFLESSCDRACEPDATVERLETIAGYVGEIADEADAHGMEVVLATYWRVNPGVCEERGGPRLSRAEAERANRHIDAFNAALIGMAERYGVEIVRLDELDLDAASFYDCMHPSDDGYRTIADAWREAL